MKNVQTARRDALPLPTRAELRDQLRTTAPVLIAALLLLAVVFLIVSVLHFQERISAYQLIDDPAPFAGLQSYTGLISHAGVVLWTGAATVCAFGGALLTGSAVRNVRELSRFLLILAAVNAWMGFDDLLVVHEDAAVRLLGWESRHVGEALFFLVYVVVMAALFWRYRQIIARSDYLILLASIVCFGISTTLDVVLQLEMGGNNVFLEAVVSRSWGGPAVDITEELLKLTGILLWLAYLARTAFAAIRDAMRPAPTTALDHQANRPAAPPRRRSRRS